MQTAENPRIEQRAAADGNRVTAGLRAHPPGVGDGPHVAVPHNGNPLDRLNHRADSLDQDRPPESLLPGAPVDRDRRDAELFELPRERGGGDPRPVPAEPHFDRDRNAHRLDHLPDQPAGAVGIAHETGPAPLPGDLGHRAAHVDIDRFVAPLFQPLGRGDEMANFSAVNLHRERFVFGVRDDQLAGPAGAGNQMRRLHEISRRQPDTPAFPDHAPERQMRVPGQGGEEVARG